MNLQSKRNNFIDILKGLAIFFMLWGHCIQYCTVGSNIDFFENSVFKFIYSFHMPLLMVISGYLFFFSFKKRAAKDLVVHRGISLLRPIIFCSMINFILTNILPHIIHGRYNNIFTIDTIKSLILSFFSLWFLWSVLISSILITFICKHIHSLCNQLIFLALASIVFVFLPNFNTNVFMYPYFILGFYYAKYKGHIPTTLKNITQCTSFILFPLLLLFYNKSHYIYTTGLIDKQNMARQIGIDVYRWIIGIVGVIFIATAVQYIYKVTAKARAFSPINKGLIDLGKNSLQYYCISVVVLSSWLPAIIRYVIMPLFHINNTLPGNPLLYNFVITPVITLIYCFVIHFIIFALRKLKLNSIIFGK